MVVINGKINSTLSGIIRATPTHLFVDTSTTPATIVNQPYQSTISGGNFSITIPQSQNLTGQPSIKTEGVTYKFELLKSDTTTRYFLGNGNEYIGNVHQHTDNLWYTGTLPHDAVNQSRLDRVDKIEYTSIQDPIYAVAPDSSTAIDFSTLISIPAQAPYLDISLYRIVEILTSNQIYKERISSKFNYRGTYSSTISYVINDIVSHNGNSYVWRNASSLTNQTPPVSGSDTNWLMIAAKGETGAGTTATIVGYNSTTWTGSNQAAARGDVKDAIASIPSPDMSNYYTKSEALPRNNAVMTGNSKRGVVSYPIAEAEKDTEIPTIRYVENTVTGLAFSRLGSPLVFARRINTQSVNLATRTTILWDNRVINTGTTLDTSGNFTVPANGDYIFYIKLFLTIVGVYAGNQTRCNMRGILHSGSTEIGDLFHDNFATVNDTWYVKREGWRYEPGLTQGEVYQLRYLIESQSLGGSGSSGVSSTGNNIAASNVNNQLLIWRI